MSWDGQAQQAQKIGCCICQGLELVARALAGCQNSFVNRVRRNFPRIHEAVSIFVSSGLQPQQEYPKLKVSICRSLKPLQFKVFQFLDTAIFGYAKRFGYVWIRIAIFGYDFMGWRPNHGP